MRYAAWSLLPVVLLLAWAVYGLVGPADQSPFAGARIEAAEPSGTKPSALPPLKVDRAAPLLLDAPPGSGTPGQESPMSRKNKLVEGPVADNMACHVCHTTYEEETLAIVHAKANVGCVKCHGPSIAHRNDEDNITPPDIIFASDRIDAACVKCHETHNAPAKKVLATWQKRCPAKENPEQLVCTDCHGEHRMKFRTVLWDKKTRKLVNRQGDHVKYAPDYTKKPGAAPVQSPRKQKPDSKP